MTLKDKNIKKDVENKYVEYMQNMEKAKLNNCERLDKQGNAEESTSEDDLYSSDSSDEGRNGSKTNDKLLKESVKTLMKKLRKYVKSNRKKTPWKYDFNMKEPQKMDEIFREVYFDMFKAGAIDLTMFNLIRLVFSAISNTASGERFFNVGGSIDSPLRNRLSPRMLEMLCIIKWFLSREMFREKVNRDSFWSKVRALLYNDTFITELQYILNLINVD